LQLGGMDPASPCAQRRQAHATWALRETTATLAHQHREATGSRVPRTARTRHRQCGTVQCVGAAQVRATRWWASATTPHVTPHGPSSAADTLPCSTSRTPRCASPRY
jgi:hypothetical protein